MKKFTNNSNLLLENVSTCPLCGGGDILPMFDMPDYSNDATEKSFSLSQCAKCTLIFLSKRPFEKDVYKYYPDSYQPFVGNYRSLVKKYIEMRTRREIALLNSYFRGIKKVLDVGCASGEYLANLKKYGNYSECVGLEIDVRAVESGRKRFGLNIVHGTLASASFPDNSFDLVTMNHVIEHVYSPKDTVEEVGRILSPGGLFMIKTPNTDTPERTLFGPSWFTYEVPRHICIFSVATLKLLLDEGGFDVIKVVYEKAPNNIILSMKNHLIGKGCHKTITDFFDIDNYLLLLASFPISWTLGVFRKSGRIAVVARKRKG